ncbi:MAG: hypothetical protein Q8N42_01405 [bacterium]|nr:hypothetical protein [bacterium]
MKQEKNINKNGFTLLLAILITSIALAISSGLSAFVIRGLSISIIGRESQKAIFAADSGIECVLYWDFNQNKFATTSSPQTISCAGSNYTVGGPGGVSIFTLNFNNGACAVVEVNKIIETYPGTRVESRGRSTCVVGSSNRVERALRVVY